MPTHASFWRTLLRAVPLKGGITSGIKEMIKKKGYTGNIASNGKVRQWLRTKLNAATAADY
jgi:hypothetical protein